jgi:hypothetical protein
MAKQWKMRCICVLFGVSFLTRTTHTADRDTVVADWRRDACQNTPDNGEMGVQLLSPRPQTWPEWCVDLQGTNRAGMDKGRQKHDGEKEEIH